MKIGDFSAEPQSSAAEGVSKTPIGGMQDGIEQALQDSVQADEEVVNLAVSFEDRLKEEGIPLKVASAIVDSLFTEGHYEETVTLSKAVTVTFRTRKLEDYDRYVRALESANLKYRTSQEALKAEYFLTASIRAYRGELLYYPGDKASPAEIEDAFTKRLNWLNTQNELVVNLLTNKLNQFDRKIQIVMSEGVVENF